MYAGLSAFFTFSKTFLTDINIIQVNRISYIFFAGPSAKLKCRAPCLIRGKKNNASKNKIASFSILLQFLSKLFVVYYLLSNIIINVLNYNFNFTIHFILCNDTLHKNERI